MTPQEILDLLNRNPAFFLASAEDGAPRVRGMLLYRADAQGIVFHTGTMKDLHRQLQANPRVELCFNDWQQQVQVRVRGVAQLIEDARFKEESIQSPGREFLKPWVEAQGRGILAVYRVEQCRATVWTLATNFEPKVFVALTA